MRIHPAVPLAAMGIGVIAAAVLGFHDIVHAATITASGDPTGTAVAVDNTRTNYMNPVIGSVVGAAAAVTFGTAAFKPDKGHLMERTAGMALCGAGAIGVPTLLITQMHTQSGQNSTPATGAIVTRWHGELKEIPRAVVVRRAGASFTVHSN